MGKKTMFLLAMAMLLLLPSQVRAQDSPQQSVDLTTRMARTTHDGLRKAKNLPSKKVDVAAAQTDVAIVPTTPGDKKRDAVMKIKAHEAAVASIVKDKKERVEMAIRDAVYGMQTIIDEFCPILGLMITKEDTPELYTLMQDVGATCDSISNRAKEKYMRTRPFVYYNQQTLVPEQEESHINNGSYPSGHTVLGWTMALLLSDINPVVADALLARGYEYGQSRVIAGYHWQSDVDAGRLGGSVLYAKLQGNERFREQLAKAQQEFREKTQGASKAKEIIAPVGTSRAYTITGVPATSETRGIIIQDGKKMLRR